MNRLILDFVRRWWWGYLGAFCFAALFIFVSLKGSSQSPRAIYPISIYFGAFLLSFEYARSSTRIYSSLPMSAREIGKAWWHLGVTLPVALSTSLRIVMMLLLSITRPEQELDWSQFFIALLWDFVYAGVGYFLLTCQPVAMKTSFAGIQNFGAGLWGAAWGLSFGSVALVSNFLPVRWEQFTLVTASAMVVGACLTMFSYTRAGKSARARMAFRPAKMALDRKKKVTTRPFIGDTLKGLPQMAWTFSGGMVAGCFFFYVLMAGVDTAMKKQGIGQFLLELGAGVDPGANHVYWFLVSIILLGSNTRVAMGIRHFRTLPLSINQLVGVCLLPTLFASVIVALSPIFFSAVINGRAPNALFFAWLFTFLGGCSLAQALFLRIRENRSTFLIVLLFVACLGATQVWIRFRGREDIAVLIPAMLWTGAVSLALSVWLIRRSLKGNSNTYKPREMPFGMTCQVNR
ncbi:MAG: hypothetical protein ACO1QB_06360 [Verrucomicrobiales bacterium]